MALLGNLLKKGIILKESIEQQFSTPYDLQKHELKKLMIHCKDTAFGKYYGFESILDSFKDKNPTAFYQTFKSKVPVFTYNTLYDQWWKMTKAGNSDICWPGKVKYFALSSGTSEAASKYIPVTKEMLKSIKKTSIRQLLALSRNDLPPKLFTKGILMLGGSTNLRNNGNYFEGDLSGITTSQIPFWFQFFYKPGKKIAKVSNWSEKLDEITLKAKDWDIGIIVGVPAWLQLLIEKIVAHYQVKNIHEIWPNLTLFIHGGVSFEPYKKGFEKLLGRPLIYMETYLASEGFIAFQALPNRSSMKLVLNNGIFYEFIPFNDENFSSDGEILPDVKTYKIDEVEEDKEYALLLTTNAGTWRYLIGDTIKFTSIAECEIIITGRIKHFLSLCGEHLSVDNMNKAIKLCEEKMNIAIQEFTVAGESGHNSLFSHRWYIGSDDAFDVSKLRDMLDDQLKMLNDDYAVERQHALKNIYVEVLPISAFYDWMRKQGKEGGQNKFPRVLKKEKLIDWKEFIEKHALIKRSC